jgi:hypothetical protein
VSTRFTVTLKLALPVLPCESVAVQVTFVVPTGKLLPEDGLHVGVSGPSTLSFALAEKVTLVPDGFGVLTLKLPGTLTTGGVWSTRFTVTLKLALPVFPCESVAVQVTFVVPTGKLLPEDGLQEGVSGPSTLSFALAENVTVVPPADSVSTEKSPGTDTTGGVVSFSVTVTVKEAEPVFPCESVALQVTVVVPTGKVLPEDGLHVGVSEPSTVSFALASPYVTAFPPGLSVEVVTFAGGVTVGGVVSCTVTVPVCSTGVRSSVVVSQVTVVCPSGKWPGTEKSPLPTVPAGLSHVAVSGFPLVGSNALTS